MRLALGAWSAGALAAGLEGRYDVAPPPPWVEPVEAPTPAAALDEGGSGVEYLLLDRQVRVEAEGSSTYLRHVKRLTSAAGVEAASTINVRFDPVNDRVTLHAIGIRRGDALIDQLTGARISVLQRESALESGIYDGRLTLHVLLSNVRAGDVIDASYTIEQKDHSFDGRFFGEFQTRWSAPVRRSRLRLLHAVGRSLRVLERDVGVEPRRLERDDWRSITWEWRDLPALHEESDTPPWHRRYPAIEVSEFADWGEVAEWAVRAYAEPSGPAPEVIAAARDAVRDASRGRDRIMRVLRFVQEEIRYTGLEIGSGAYLPTSTAAVLQRRYGDCKDKARVMSAMLRALEVDAHPALVSASLHRAVADALPSPGAFDHVVVHVRSGERAYWLDPTLTAQGGELDTVVQADFGSALVVDGGTRSLSRMHPPRASAPSIEVDEDFDLRAGLRNGGALSVTTRYFGAEADRQRQRLRGATLEEVSRNYLNYYKGRYPQITQRALASVEDDLSENQLTIGESYEIGEPFAEQSDGSLRFDFHSFLVTGYAAVPATTVRTAPLQLVYPMDARHSIRVRLPEDWTVEPYESSITGPAFAYESRVGYGRRVLSARYTFRTLADHVSAADLAEYLSKIDQVRVDVFYSLTHRGDPRLPSPDRMSPPVVALLIVGVGAGGLTARWMSRYRPRPKGSPEAGAPRGIRGWLIGPALHVLLLPAILIFTLSQVWQLLDDAVWRSLEPAVQVLLGGMVFGAVALLVSSPMLIYLMFRRRSAFPRLYIASTWTIVVFGAIVVIGLAIVAPSDDNELVREIGSLVRDLISAVLWTAYMLCSARVRATFTETGSPAEAGPAFDLEAPQARA